MSASVKVVLTYSQVTKPAGSPQTASIAVSIHDANGVQVGSSVSIACDANGAAAANEADFTVAAGTGYTAIAQSLDASGAATGPAQTTPAFDAQDDVAVTVVASITKA